MMHKRTAGVAGLIVAGFVVLTCATACAPGTSESVAGDVPQAETATESSSTVATVREQIAILTGTDESHLVPIEGAQAWLGGSGLAAYVDTSTHDEFIVDESNEMVLGFDTGSRIYQDPIDLAQYPGEPSRDSIEKLADDFARQHAPDRDISTMRRMAWRRVSGSGEQGETLEYLVMYRRYVRGIQVTEYASVDVMLPTWVWTPSMSAHEIAAADETPPAPEVTMLEALETASGEVGFADWKVTECALRTWKGEFFWTFQLENVNTEMDSGHGAGVRIDAITGECIEVAGCG